MTPCLTSRGRPTTAGVVFAIALLVAACATGTTTDTAATPTPTPTTDPSELIVMADVGRAFGQYRSGVSQGDADAVVESVTEESVAQQARIAEVARTATAEEIRAMPAADQLTVLTYRLRPHLLAADDPFRALVSEGLAGQDRTLGELGDIEVVNEDLALGLVLDGTTLRPTPLRWRFVREGGAWRFDLANAQLLVSQAVQNTARQSDVQVSDVVTATIADLSGEDLETVQALYREPPAG